jgi:glucose-6-phosphate 1-dehydrogenase
MADNELESTILVIVGITGNLAKQRLLPALYHLIKDHLLPEDTEIVGTSRRDVSVEELLKDVELCVLESDKVCDPQALAEFRRKLRMVRFDPAQAADYDSLLKTLEDIETSHKQCMNRLFYLSIPPQVYEPVIKNFGLHHLNQGCPHRQGVTRLLVEKPFGYDLISAQELIRSTNHYFSENQIFRIDHYLAKETVQNILVFRAHNPIFNSLWSSQYISKITIDLREPTGIESRADFYDNVGALRDVVQNHLLQLLALVTMELPKDLDDNVSLHKAKQALLANIKPVDMKRAKVVRAQYNGYRQEVNNPRSNTETFVSLTFDINNKRWKGVPVRLTAGKALKDDRSTIQLTFGPQPGSTTANTLTFRVQPDEGIDIELTAKRPGFEDKTEAVRMDFSYQNNFVEPGHPDAYERVLVDAVRGDHSLFATSEEVLATWRILQPVLNAWAHNSDDLKIYEIGSDGPTGRS